MVQGISERTRLILLCSPNNPTGPRISNDEFEAFMAQVPSDVLIVLDKAYWKSNTDSTAVDGLPATKKNDKLVIVRTLSKAQALACFRTGYVVGNPQLISTLR